MASYCTFLTVIVALFVLLQPSPTAGQNASAAEAKLFFLPITAPSVVTRTSVLVLTNTVAPTCLSTILTPIVPCGRKRRRRNTVNQEDILEADNTIYLEGSSRVSRAVNDEPLAPEQRLLLTTSTTTTTRTVTTLATVGNPVTLNVVCTVSGAQLPPFCR